MSEVRNEGFDSAKSLALDGVDLLGESHSFVQCDASVGQFVSQL